MASEESTVKKPSIIFQIIALLSERDLSNAPTLGDMARLIGLPVGTAIGERVREARQQGWDIRCTVEGSGKSRKFAYFLPARQRARARAMVAAWIAKQLAAKRAEAA
jgi:hypothetical protein